MPKAKTPTPDKQWNLLWGRRNRLEAKKKKLALQLEELKEQLGEIDDEAKQLLRQAGVQGVKTKFCNISMTPDLFPKVDDWEAFYEHIRETDSFELLERRPAKVACRERWSEDDKIPGVSSTPIARVRWTKS